MRKIIFVLICLLCLVCCSCSSSIEQPKEPKITNVHTSKIKWRKYSDARLAASLKEKKPVMILFTRLKCSACLSFKMNTLEDPLVARYINKDYDPLIVRSTDTRFFDLAEKFEVDAVPTLIIIKSKAKLVIRGNISADDLLLILTFF